MHELDARPVTPPLYAGAFGADGTAWPGESMPPMFPLHAGGSEAGEVLAAALA